MGHKRARLLCHLVILSLCSVSLLSMSCAAKFAGHQAETTMPFAEGEVQPDLTGPFMYKSMKTKIGEPDKKGRQKIRLFFKVKNMTNKDYRVYMAVSLLDEEGQTVALRNDRELINDEMPGIIIVGFRKLTEAQVASIKEVKIRVAYERA